MDYEKAIQKTFVFVFPFLSYKIVYTLSNILLLHFNRNFELSLWFSSLCLATSSLMDVNQTKIFIVKIGNN